MKKIKRILCVALALIMTMSLLCACGGKAEKKEETDTRDVAGMLSAIGTTEEKLNKTSEDTKWIFYDTLDSMLLALQSGKIVRANNIPDCVGQYVTGNNDKFKFEKPSALRTAVLNYHMGVMKDNTDLQTLLNNTILEMQKDGTLDKLASEYIDGYILNGKTPDPIEIPKIEGADTLNVAITGDLPPIDFVTADGKAAGFNVALLAEISKRANININLVNVNSASRSVSLTSGKVDVIFWVATVEYQDSKLNETEANVDVPENVALTETYYKSNSGQLVLK
ncbi:MAG: transporter substrate-binding domain-containing protein [Clostridia bacterium]|nr:transporter substrate-binding domain-containing protein [Clostridia bacterium]